MNEAGEQILQAFRKVEQTKEQQHPFLPIANIICDGSIAIEETQRSVSYRSGFSSGDSFSIVARGRDAASRNPLDQIVSVWQYNAAHGMYEVVSERQIRGETIEQSRLTELLSGDPKNFEQFISRLFYHVKSDGTIDQGQYLYFDAQDREIIFFSEDTQQVFTWLTSNRTRLGIYISSQNISVATLRRYIDVELESLDSIRIRIFEDVRMKIALTAQWDGSYRRMTGGVVNAPASRAGKDATNKTSWVDAEYDSRLGRLTLRGDGVYAIGSAGTEATGNHGRYSFFTLAGARYITFLPDHNKSITMLDGEQITIGVDTSGRETWSVEEAGKSSVAPATTGAETDTESEAGATAPIPGQLILRKVRLGTRGAQILEDAPLVLTPVAE
jgi:hypothetical protein